MEKKSKNNASAKNSSGSKIDHSLKGASEFLMKEKEYEEYLKRIEKLSRGLYNI